MEEFTQIAALLLPVIYWTRKGAFGLAVDAFRGSQALSQSSVSAASSKAKSTPSSGDFWGTLKGALHLPQIKFPGKVEEPLAPTEAVPPVAP